MAVARLIGGLEQKDPSHFVIGVQNQKQKQNTVFETPILAMKVSLDTYSMESPLQALGGGRTKVTALLGTRQNFLVHNVVISESCVIEKGGVDAVHRHENYQHCCKKTWKTKAKATTAIAT